MALASCNAWCASQSKLGSSVRRVLSTLGLYADCMLIPDTQALWLASQLVRVLKIIPANAMNDSSNDSHDKSLTAM